MFELILSGKFKKDLKKCIKRNFNMLEINEVFILLQNNGELPAKYKPHTLSGNYSNCWECHIKPDWLLIWRINPIEKQIFLERTGTHSDLF
jgi:mRNA interferase YafQ